MRFSVWYCRVVRFGALVGSAVWSYVREVSCVRVREAAIVLKVRIGSFDEAGVEVDVKTFGE